MPEPAVPWDEGFARAVVRIAVRRKRQLFTAFADVGLDDLHAEAMLAARRAWARFDPARSKPSTFISLAANRRLLTLSRDLSRRRRRDQTAHEVARGRLLDSLRPGLHHEADDTDLTDWLGNVYRTARRNLIGCGMPLREPKANRRYPDRAQRAAMLLLKRRLKLSSRGVVVLLSTRPDLLAVVELAAPPHYSSVSRLEKSVARTGMLRQPRRKPVLCGE